MKSLSGQAKTMSSMEIAKLTEKEHRNVMVDIRRILKEAEIDEQAFMHIYLDAYKREQPCYNLPRRECDLVVSGYSVKYRLAIIDRWQELEAQAQEVPDFSNPLVLLPLLEQYARKLAAAEAQIEADAPAVQFAEEIGTKECERHISATAKALFNGSVKEGELRAWLRLNEWLKKTENEPTAWAIGRGFMRLRPEIVNGRQYDVPVVTAKGFETLRHLFREGELFVKIPGKGIAVQRPQASA